MSRADLVADPLVRPRRLRPVAVAVAGADQDGGRVAAVGESAAKARVDADVDQRTAGPEHSRGLAQHGRVAGDVGMRHDRDNRRQRVVPDGQALSVGHGDDQAPAGMPQHPGGDIDTHGGPAQAGDSRRVDTGAAGDLEAGAAALAEQLAQALTDAERIGGLGVPRAKELVLVPVRDLVVRRPHSLIERRTGRGHQGSSRWASTTRRA
jgi:hypothetical protein